MEKAQTGNKTIPINIWDDFEDKTFAYVEDYSLSHDLQHESLCTLRDVIVTLSGDLPIKYSIHYIKFVGTGGFERWELHIENITHEILYQLVGVLQRCNLNLYGIPFKIYSES
jgi:hypothetical protein